MWSSGSAAWPAGTELSLCEVAYIGSFVDNNDAQEFAFPPARVHAARGRLPHHDGTAARGRRSLACGHVVLYFMFVLGLVSLTLARVYPGKDRVVARLLCLYPSSWFVTNSA